MTFPSLLVPLALLLVLAACETQPMAPPAQTNVQFELKLANGNYLCKQGMRVQIERDCSYSGLQRFEDTASSLVWIDLPWKGMLLDGKTNKPLANECSAA